MQRAWLCGIAGLMGVLLIDSPMSFGGHGGHGGGSHSVKAGHEGSKHSGGKPAPHAAPKPTAKPTAKPQSKPALKPLPKPQMTPKENHAHKPEAGKSKAKPNRTNPSGSVAKTHPPTTKDDKPTHHDGHHHHDHHEWHHDRWWHGHHHVWSEEGYWVDATTGAPVAADDGAVGTDAVVTGSAPGAVAANRPQIHFSVDPSERNAYDAAAQAAGMSRADWIRSRLNAALDNELK
jgi:hypothetical protein